jgi:rod shape-determining protein MreD
VVLVTLVAVALLRGPVFGAVSGFWVGLVLDTASFGTFGLTSLLLTVAGYWTGRFGELTTRASAHPLLIAVALGTVGVALGSAVLHFMLGVSIPASQLFFAVLLPGLAFNLLLAYPVYALCARILPPRLVVRREMKPAV